MKDYTIKSPDLPNNTLRSYKAENREDLETQLKEDGLDCYKIV